jgi:hypothetical protein
MATATWKSTLSLKSGVRTSAYTMGREILTENDLGKEAESNPRERMSKRNSKRTGTLLYPELKSGAQFLW